MKPWETLARATTPDGSDFALARRGDEFAIRVGGQLLMSSRQHGSEDALARVACDAVADAPAPVVLIGGLGLGYTLRAALDRLPSKARVVVAELVPALVEWNRGVLAPLAQRPLDDPRVEVVTGDVADVIANARASFDVIALDVDNGPSALTSPANARLYGSRGLASARRALRPGGAYIVWSAGEDRAFERRLAEAGFEPSVERIDPRTGTRGTRHVLFVGRL